MAPPFRDAEFDIMYGEGISRTGDLLDMGVAADIIDKSGAWYSYTGERIGQGRENAKSFLKDNPDIFTAIHEKVMEAMGLSEKSETESDEEKKDK
jgi:recombination protein RecA